MSVKSLLRNKVVPERTGETFHSVEKVVWKKRAIPLLQGSAIPYSLLRGRKKNISRWRDIRLKSHESLKWI